MSIYSLKLIVGSEVTAEKTIKLQIEDSSEKVVRVLFDIIWQDIEIKEWLVENRSAILSEEIPVFAPKASCIAESVERFYGDESNPSDGEFNEMYEYRTRHGFRFALRGTIIEDIYIGLFKGEYQISVRNNGSVFYSFVSIESLFEGCI